MMRQTMWAAAFTAACAGTAAAVEITVKNDSLIAGGNVAIVWGFVQGEKAASWLTSPCNGNLVAAQIFWRSPNASAPQAIEDSIEISRSGTFPTPGAVAQTINGPVLADGAFNEYRYLDENNTVPLTMQLTQGETFVVAFTFANAPTANSGPSLVRDADGIQSNRNAIYANVGGNFVWMSAATLGLTGDWVIRAVVDCPAAPTAADVSVTMTTSPPQYTAGQPLTYSITVANAGPANSPNTTVVDTFPAALTNVQWTCVANGAATCPGLSGSGNLAASISLPANTNVVFTATGTVAAGTTAPIVNSATAVVGGNPPTDPNTTNNTAIATTTAAPNDLIFEDGFDPRAGGSPPVVQARVTGRVSGSR